MHAHDVAHWRGEQAVGVSVAQVGLGAEWKLREVREGVQIVGPHAGGVEFLAIVRDIVVGALQRPFQALEL